MGDRQDESLKQPAPSLNHHKGLCDYGSVSILRWLAAIRQVLGLVDLDQKISRKTDYPAVL